MIAAYRSSHSPVRLQCLQGIESPYERRVALRGIKIKGWAQEIRAAFGAKYYIEVDRALGQAKGRFSRQLHGRGWPSAVAQSRAADAWGVGPIGIDPERRP